MCVFKCKRRRLSAVQLRRGPLIPCWHMYVYSTSHRRVVTLADRRPHSFRPPSGLHQSVLLFNNSQGTCRIYIHSHVHRISKRMALDSRTELLFIWFGKVHSTFVTTQHQEPTAHFACTHYELSTYHCFTVR